MFRFLGVLGVLCAPVFAAWSDDYVQIINEKLDIPDEIVENMYNTYDAVQELCGGISDEISHITGVAAANTAVSAVGTAVAGGALATGIVKAQTDKKVAELSQQICQIGGCDPDKVETMTDEEFAETILPLLVQLVNSGNSEEISRMIALKQQQDMEIAKSKKLGNWRTGLLAGTIGTNVTTAIIAGLNKDQSDLIQHVSACNSALEKLRNVNASAIAAGINPIDDPLLQKFSETLNKCGTLNVADIEKIEKRMGVVMGTGITGATIGAVGVGTSAAANTDKIRNDNTDAGKQKEKTLNTIANIAAGANVATGAIETGVNISLITLTKRLIQSAQECEGAL